MLEKSLVITNDHNERIDKFLTDKLSSLSRTEIQSYIKAGHIKVNKRRVKANYRCQKEDVITLALPKEKKELPRAEKIALSILYEDDSLLVLNKPKGMVVHPSQAHPSGTLVNGLLYHRKELASIGDEGRPGIVHRLDKDTSGLLVVAKTEESYHHFIKEFSGRRVERIYGALVHGEIPHQKGVIKAPIGRNPKIRTQMAVREDGREAITHFTVKQSFKGYTYVKCKLITGRTHQLRIHLNYIGHSIVGEPIYIDHKTLDTKGQMLFAKTLGFVHPRTKEKMYFNIPIPDYFQEVINLLGED